MLQHEFRKDVGILVVRPTGPLTAEDFATLTREIDPDMERAGPLQGLLLEARRFPGWRNLRALLAHVRFVQDHHRKIRRIAVVTDDRVLAILLALVRHFVGGRGQALPGGGARRGHAVGRGRQAWHLSPGRLAFVMLALPLARA